MNPVFKLLSVVGVLATLLSLLAVVIFLFNQPSWVAILCGFVTLATTGGICIMFLPKYVRSLISAVLLAVLLPALTTGCTRINPGYVGIKVNNAGDNRGVESAPQVTGWVFYMPGQSTIYEYPTFNQNAIWSANPSEGHPTNEEITFTTSDKMVVSVDVSLAYQLVSDKVPHFYVKFRNDNLDAFTHGFLRNLARDHFNVLGGKYTIDQIMGDNGPFIQAVRSSLQMDLDPIGVQLTQFGFIGAPRPPKNIIDSINAKVEADQITLRKQAELMQTEADAAKQVAAAEGEAKSRIARAQGEAEANRLLTASLSQQLLEWRRLSIQEQAVTAWDKGGAKLPVTYIEGGKGGSLPSLLLNTTGTN